MPLPKLPRPPSPIRPLIDVIHQGREQVEKARDDIRSIAGELKSTATGEPSIEPTETKTPPAEGTACLACSRDHFSTTSSALSEALRFARSDGIKHPEVTRRLGIALDELNIMERIDLAPDQLGMLNEAERKLAIWALGNSRELRHIIGEAKTVDALEKAASKASKVREEFMKRLWELPEECLECLSLQSLREYIEKGKRLSNASAGGEG